VVAALVDSAAAASLLTFAPAPAGHSTSADSVEQATAARAEAPALLPPLPLRGDAASKVAAEAEEEAGSAPGGGAGRSSGGFCRRECAEIWHLRVSKSTTVPRWRETAPLRATLSGAGGGDGDAAASGHPSSPCSDLA